MKKEIIDTCEFCNKEITTENDFHMDDEGVVFCDACCQEMQEDEYEETTEDN